MNNGTPPNMIFGVYADAEGKIGIRAPDNMSSLDALRLMKQVEAMIMAGALEKRGGVVEAKVLH